MGNDRQELMQWLDRLGEYVRSEGLPTRIADRIQECKSIACSENADEAALRTEIGELLDSIEKKKANDPATIGRAEKAVTSEDIEKELRRMAQTCQRQNEGVVADMEERKGLILQRCYTQIKDIAKTEAHVSRLKNTAEYMQFFEQVSAGYEQDVSLLIADLLEGIKSGYSHMLDHIRSMLRSVDAFRSGQANAKVFEELEQQRDALGKTIQAEIGMEAAGRKQIIPLAQRTEPEIQKIVKKKEKKQKLLVSLPWILTLTLFVMDIVIKMFRAMGQSSDSDKLGALKTFLEILGSFGALMTSFFFLFIAIILLIIVAYAMYVKAVKKSCLRATCRESAVYLQKELTGFEQSGCLRTALDETVKNALDRYNEKYLILLNCAFADPQYGEKQEKKERFRTLVEEWQSMM